LIRAARHAARLKRFSSTFSNRDARDASMDEFIDSVIAQATA
jgi:hypothetical protein